MRVKFLSLLFVVSFVLFSGCTSKNSQVSKTFVQKVEVSNAELEEDDFLNEFEDELEVKTVYDPFQKYNRIMTNFNDGLYEYVLYPISSGYIAVTNVEVRESVGNVFHNILYPVRFINNLLQGKFMNGLEETGRFLINSTVGLFGIFDIAKNEFSLEAHNEDFGQTLGYWGVGSGPHIVLPFLGPSNLRDALGMYPDSFINPIDYHTHRGYNLSNSFSNSLNIKIFNRVNAIALSDNAYGKMKEDAVDLYPYIRNIYEQLRKQQIKE